MVRVKYIGSHSVVVAGKHLLEGETREVTEAQARALEGVPGILFLDEVPVQAKPKVTVLKVQIVDEEPLQPTLEVATAALDEVQATDLPAAATAASTPPLPKGDAISTKVRKPRSKKK